MLRERENERERTPMVSVKESLVLFYQSEGRISRIEVVLEDGII